MGRHVRRRTRAHFERWRCSDPLSVRRADADALSDPRASAIAEDARGNLWIGTAGGGLNLLDRKTGRFHHYRRNDRDPNSLATMRSTRCTSIVTATLWIGAAVRPRLHGQALRGPGGRALREPVGLRGHDAAGRVRGRVGCRRPAVAQHEQRPDRSIRARARASLPRSARSAGRRFNFNATIAAATARCSSAAATASTPSRRQQ